MSVKDSRNYRRLMLSVAGLAILFCVLAIVFYLIDHSLLLLLGPMGIVVSVIGLLTVGHFRMRMIFSAINNSAKRANIAFASDLSRMSDSVEETLREQLQQSERGVSGIESRLLRQISDVSREVIANDSMLDAKLMKSSRALSEKIEVCSQAFHQALSDNSAISASERRVQKHRLDQYAAAVNSLFRDLDGVVAKVSHKVDDLFEALKQVDSRIKREADRHQSSAKSQSSAISNLQSRLDSTLVLQRTLESELTGQFNQICISMEDLITADRRGVPGLETKVDEACRLIIGLENLSKSGFDKTYEKLELGVHSVTEIIENACQCSGVKNKIDGLSESVSTDLAELGSRFASLLQSTRSETSGDLSLMHERLEGLLLSVDGRSQSASSHVRDQVSSSLARVERLLEEGFGRIGDRNQELFNATQSKLQQLRGLGEQLPKDINDYCSLLDRFSVRSTDTPLVGGWAATVPVLRSIVGEILDRPNVDLVLDVGSGTSTVWSALAMRERGYGKCIALEHDEEFASNLRDVLSGLGLEDWADVIHAPLVPWTPSREFEIGGDSLPHDWYDPDAVAGLKFDVVFVDGPPGQSLEYSRFPALDVLAPHLRDQCMIILDDTIRVEEKAIIELWTNLPFAGGKVHVESVLSKSTVMRYVKD